MFYVIRKNRNYTEDIISKHRIREIAEEKCRKAEEKHELHLSAFGWKSDCVEFYVKEV